METIRYTQLGKEDIRFGTGTFEARLADGRVVVLSEVNLGALLSDSDKSDPFIATGTWTPAVGGTATYSAQTGYFWKMGSLVHVMCDLGIDVIGTGTTAGLSSGCLPYPVKTGTVFVASVSFSSLIANAINVVVHAIPSGTIQFRSSAAAGSGLLTTAILGDGSSIRFSGSYLTD